MDEQWTPMGAALAQGNDSGDWPVVGELPRRVQIPRNVAVESGAMQLIYSFAPERDSSYLPIVMEAADQRSRKGITTDTRLRSGLAAHVPDPYFAAAFRGNMTPDEVAVWMTTGSN